METEPTKKSQLNLNIALLPPPGFIGHLIPFIELAKNLVSHHNFTVTLIIPEDGTPMKFQRSLLEGLTAKISPIFLPPVSTDDLPEGVHPEVLIPIRVRRSLPALRNALSGTTPAAAALVVDLFSPDAIDVARELGIPAYIFYVIAANELSMDLPERDESSSLAFGDIALPGGIILKADDLPDAMKDRDTDLYRSGIDLSKKCVSADAIFVNSFNELESEALQHLSVGVPPVYPVGPLIRTAIGKDDSESTDHCLKWLDEQPDQSVVFVSFGSGATLSLEQISELALGLEMSKHRFLWVVRSPHDNAAAAYVSAAGDGEPLEFLPQGFLERTRGTGLVVASWAPQIRVLSHPATGGFLTQCGWNSILEAAVHGVPLIAWPLCFEHKMNAVFVTDGLKGAIRVRENENGIVDREEVANVLKQLMEGEQGLQIRNKMKQLKIAAANVMRENGSSTMPLARAVQNYWAANGN